MAKQVTIVAGDISDQAQTFLLAHGAKIEGSHGLDIITLPETAHVDRDTYVKGQYYIWWYGPDDNEEEQFIEVELDIDAYETRVRLIKQ